MSCKMNKIWFLVVITSVTLTSCDIYFPYGEMSDMPHRNDYVNAKYDDQDEKYVSSVIAQGVTNLCLSIDRTIAAMDRTGAAEYIVFSPISIASSLALLLLGSVGKTFDEISSVLGLAHGVNIANNSESVHQQFGELLQEIENSSTGLKQHLKFANGIFVQNDYPIRHQYRKLSEDLYSSEISSLDFKNNANKALYTINNWVSGKTNGKIKDILGSVPPPSTRVVIVSALYFINEWERPFAPETTQRRPFYGNGKNQPSTTEIEQMATGGEFPYFSDRVTDSQLLGLPYKGGQVVFYMVIPRNSTRQKLRDLENRLNTNELNRMVSSAKITPAIVAMPKMKLTSTIQLNNVLENIGLRSLFDPYESSLGILSPGILTNVMKPENSLRNPDAHRLVFSRSGNLTVCYEGKNCEVQTQRPEPATRQKRDYPNGRNVVSSVKYDDSIDYLRQFLYNNKNEAFANPGLYADQILHKVYIDVTEKGTEAAAATSISLSRDGSRLVFKADVPFFFFIRHEQTKMILFWGSVYIPSPHFA